MLSRQIIIRVTSGVVLLLGISLIVVGAVIPIVPVIVSGFATVALGYMMFLGTMVQTRYA